MESLKNLSEIGAILWPVIVFTCFLILLEPIKVLLRKVSSVKGLGFNFIIGEMSNKEGMPNVINELAALSYDELKLFLIIAGEDSNRYRFQDTSKTKDESKNMYNKLFNQGLIKVLKIEDNGDKGQKINFITTDKGTYVHKAIIDSIYFEIIRSRE